MPSPLRKLFRRCPVTAAKTTRRRRWTRSIQPLEDRRLMAADVSFEIGTEPAEKYQRADEIAIESTPASAPPRDVLVLIGPNGELIYTSS